MKMNDELMNTTTMKTISNKKKVTNDYNKFKNMTVLQHQYNKVCSHEINTWLTTS